MATLLQLISNAIFYCSTLLLGDKCTIRFFLQNFSRKFCYPTEINNKMDRVYVGNLPPDIRIKDIDDFFRPFGKLIFIDVNHRANPVYAYVQFDSARNAFNAVKARHGYDYEGYTLQMRLVENEVRKRRDVTPPPPPPPMINDYGSSRTGGNYSNSSMTSFQSSSNSQWSNNDRSNMQSQQQNMSRPNMSQQNMLDFSSNNRSKMQQQNIMSYPSSERPNNNSNRSNMSQQYNNKNRSNMQQQQYSNSNRSNMPQDNMMNYSNRNNLNMSNMNYTNTNRYNMQQQEDMNTMDYLKNSNWVIGNNGSWNSGNNNGWWNNGNNDGSWNNGNNTNSSWNTGNNSSWNNDNNSFWNNGNNNSWNNGNNGSWNNGNNGSWNNGNNSSWNSGNNNVGNNMGWNAGNNGGNNYNNNVPPYVYNPNNDPYARAGFEDSFTSGLSGSGRKWFNRYIRKGFSPEMARSKALEHRTVPYLRDDPKVNPDPNDPTNAALETIGTTILSLLSTNPADNFNNDNQIMPTFSNWGGDNFQAGFDMPGPSTSNARGGATMNQIPSKRHTQRLANHIYTKSVGILEKMRKRKSKGLLTPSEKIFEKFHMQIISEYEELYMKARTKNKRLKANSNKNDDATTTRVDSDSNLSTLTKTEKQKITESIKIIEEKCSKESLNIITTNSESFEEKPLLKQQIFLENLKEETFNVTTAIYSTDIEKTSEELLKEFNELRQVLFKLAKPNRKEREKKLSERSRKNKTLLMVQGGLAESEAKAICILSNDLIQQLLDIKLNYDIKRKQEEKNNSKEIQIKRHSVECLQKHEANTLLTINSIDKNFTQFYISPSTSACAQKPNGKETSNDLLKEYNYYKSALLLKAKQTTNKEDKKKRLMLLFHFPLFAKNEATILSKLSNHLLQKLIDKKQEYELKKKSEQTSYIEKSSEDLLKEFTIKKQALLKQVKMKRNESEQISVAMEEKIKMLKFQGGLNDYEAKILAGLRQKKLRNLIDLNKLYIMKKNQEEPSSISSGCISKNTIFKTENVKTENNNDKLNIATDLENSANVNPNEEKLNIATDLENCTKVNPTKDKLNIVPALNNSTKVKDTLDNAAKVNPKEDRINKIYNNYVRFFKLSENRDISTYSQRAKIIICLFLKDKRKIEKQKCLPIQNTQFDYLLKNKIISTKTFNEKDKNLYFKISGKNLEQSIIQYNEEFEILQNEGCLSNTDKGDNRMDINEGQINNNNIKVINETEDKIISEDRNNNNNNIETINLTDDLIIDKNDCKQETEQKSLNIIHENQYDNIEIKNLTEDPTIKCDNNNETMVVEHMNTIEDDTDLMEIEPTENVMTRIYSPARNRVSKQQYLKSLNILKKLRAKRVQSAQDRLSKKYHTQIVKDYEQFEKLSAKAPRLSTSSTNPRNERQILAAASGGKTYTELTVTLRKKKQQLLLAARRMRSDPNKRIGGAYKKRMKILINEYGFPDIEAKSLAVHPMEKLQPLLSLKADCDRALNKKQDIFSVNKRVSSNDRKNAAYRNDINYLKMYEKRKFDNLSPRVKTALRRCLARIHKHEKDANLPLTKTRFTKLLPSKDGPKTNTTATTRKKQNDDNKKTVKNTNKSTAAEKKTNETTKTTKKEEDKKKDKSTDATTEETPEQHVEENAEENKNNEEEHHEQEEEGGGNEEEYEDAEHRENEENEEQNGEE